MTAIRHGSDLLITSHMLGMAAPEVCQQEAEGSQAQPGMLSSDLFILV
jgi:hypothetical protein